MKLYESPSSLTYGSGWQKVEYSCGYRAFNLFMSEGAAHKLGLKIEDEPGRIKTVNLESVPIKGVAKGVDLQLGT
ncbi:hypothetical protein J1N35_015173 [Gossypium stocksii]|uniref:Uncharacterized protein n=1 Tax=Gossypium stocksii TaxID=47602 RepID=A0A9D3VVX5_9ROSI|nr:hypothetical protein J1N35_015173 [Gossypium stocksii]